jgi:uncharacterized membrane protein
MTTLTPFHLTPLGLFHTLVSLVAVLFAFLAILREKGVTPKTPIGRIYLWSLLITTITGFPIIQHGTIGPPHVVGALTLVVLAVAAVAEWTHLFGSASEYIKTIAYSTTILLLMIPTVTETLTRVPPGAPLVAGPEAPIFKPLYAVLLVMFLDAVTLQVRRLRAARLLDASRVG